MLYFPVSFFVVQILKKKEMVVTGLELGSFAQLVLFQVCLIDWGREEEGPVENLRPLDKEFSLGLRGCMRCHLADVSAPGGTDNWPSSSKDRLAEQLQQHANNLFMTLKVTIHH